MHLPARWCCSEWWGYFAGVVQAPITAFVIVIEMTDNHQLALPLMATALVAAATSRLICPWPVYKALAEGFLARTKGGETPAQVQGS